MQVSIKPAVAIRSLQKFFTAKTGQKLQYAEAMEFFATMCGFSEHRALVTEEAKQDASKSVPPSPTILDKLVFDWEFHDDAQGAVDAGKQRRPYRITADSFDGSLQVQVLPDGILEENYEGHPAMFLWLEINGGVPMVTLSNNREENLLSVFSTAQGFLIRRERDEFESIETADVPEGSDLANVIAEKAKFFDGKFCDGVVQLHNTGVDYKGVPLEIMKPDPALMASLKVA